MDEIIKYCEKLEPLLIKVRRELHKNAKLGFKEYKTKNILIKYLDETNMSYRSIKDSTEIVVLVYRNSPITIRIRADMDSLPIEEKCNIDYKSENKGVMHTCGHDTHLTIALGLCKVLNKFKDRLKVNVKFIFQPVEEVGCGKIIVNSGVLENPKVDYIFTLHVDPHLLCESLEIKPGIMADSTDRLHITVKGKKATEIILMRVLMQ